MTELQKNIWRGFVSIFIFAVLAVQFAVSVVKEDWYWPFMDYPMYSGTLHMAGDRISIRRLVYAVHADGSEVKLKPEDIGATGFWVFQNSFSGQLLRHSGEESRRGLKPTIVAFIDHYEAKSKRDVVALRIEDTGALITKQGMKPAEQKTLRILAVPRVGSRESKN